MNLADSMKKSDDNFKVLLNWRGKYTFTQDSCVYDGEKRTMYAVPLGSMQYYVIAPTDVGRDAIFASFDKISEKLPKHAATGKYAAVLLHDGTTHEPIIVIDASREFVDAEFLFILGKYGEIALLAYDDADLRARLRDAVDSGVDFAAVRRGGEAIITRTFGGPDEAQIIPPDERREDGDTADGGDGGDASGGSPAADPGDAGDAVPTTDEQTDEQAS